MATVLIIFIDTSTYSSCNYYNFVAMYLSLDKTIQKLVNWFCGNIRSNVHSYFHANLLIIYPALQSQPFILLSHILCSPPSHSMSTDTCKTAVLSQVGLNKNGYCQYMQWLPHEYCLVLRRLYSTLQPRRYCSFPTQLDKNSNYFYSLSPIFHVELIKMLIYWVLPLCLVHYLIDINYICS